MFRKSSNALLSTAGAILLHCCCHIHIDLSICSTCDCILLSSPINALTSFPFLACVFNEFSIPLCTVFSVIAKTAFCTSFVCLKFGIVCWYSLTSLSVNTHTSPYTHLARLGIIDIRCDFSACACVSYGLFEPNIHNIGHVAFVFHICFCMSHNEDNTVLNLSSFCIAVSVILPHPKETLNISSAVASGSEKIAFLSAKYASYFAFSVLPFMLCGLNVVLLNLE